MEITYKPVFQSCVVSNGSKTVRCNKCKSYKFQSCVVSNGSKTLDYWDEVSVQFQSCVVSNGSKTPCVYFFVKRVFQSCVVSNGSKTLALKWHVVNLVLELCCFEWFQNRTAINTLYTESFRAVLFRMVPKPMEMMACQVRSFRAVLFRMVPKL